MTLLAFNSITVGNTGYHSLRDAHMSFAMRQVRTEFHSIGLVVQVQYVQKMKIVL